MAHGTTVADLIDHLTAGSGHAWSVGQDEDAFLVWFTRLCAWPPNVFAVTAAILHESGLYRIEVPMMAPKGTKQDAVAWIQALKGIVHVNQKGWRGYVAGEPCCSGDIRLPKVLADLARVFNQALSHEIEPDDENCNPDVRAVLLQLHCLADEACFELGVPRSCRQRTRIAGSISDTTTAEHERELEALKTTSLDGTQLDEAVDRLNGVGTLSCFEPIKIRILPKKHTPQVGVTLRSISLYVGAVRGEVDVTWRCPPSTLRDAPKRPLQDEERRTNLLLVPWPFELLPSAFSSQRVNGYNQFDYVLKPLGSTKAEAAGYMTRLLTAAGEIAGEIDGVIFPELALDERSFAAVLSATREQFPDAFVLAGVGGLMHTIPTNEAWLDVEGETLKQQKHHRWCIDASQIRQYHLGTSLLADDSRRYWERMNIGSRTIGFTHLRPGTTICHLICEDLARVEPVAEVIRAVGPNLVVALLLDGPQLERRWPGRYASIFADDPGSSVLTLSSLGMVRRSRGADNKESTVVALWKDQRTGTRELSISPNAHGLVLSLSMNLIQEWTFDGRNDGMNTGLLSFAGVNELRLKPAS